MATLADIVFDCGRPASLARFRVAVPDDDEVAPCEDEDFAGSRSIGVTNVGDDPTVLVQPSSGAGPSLVVRAVPESKRVKNRVHLDVRSNDVDSEVERSQGLGAHVVEDQPNEGPVVLRDPEGNEFCVVRP